MTPNDLKTGHVCLHANGRYSMVVKDTCEKMANEDQGNLIFSSSNRTGIKEFNEDFTWLENRTEHQQGIAIIKVYKPHNICEAVQIFSQENPDLNNFELVWDKSLKHEVTPTTEKITQKEKGTTMNSLKVKAFEEMLAMAMPSRRYGESIMIDTMLKAMTAAKPAKPKFLTLNVVNGQANIKEMIHQAYFADIKDPRPFIQDMLKKELIRLFKYLETIPNLRSNLGFNLKLRGMFETLLDITKNPANSMTIEDAVRVYEFQKEYDNYQNAVQANGGVCPYQWIEAHLTHDNLNSTKQVDLFMSNKIQIFIKNGFIIYQEETLKANYSFKAEIKFSVIENKFSL